MRKIIYRSHLFFGLLSGLVVFIVAITGCCWVFQEEITNLTESHIQIIPEEGCLLPATKVKEIASEVFPEQTIHGVLYGKPDEPIDVIFYDAEPEFYYSVYLHPNTGEILKIKNYRSGFFWFVLRGHLYLWLPPVIGAEIVRYGTMVFVFLLISGILLWWPRNRKGIKQRVSFSWKPTTKWRRKNFDLHSIVGFYVSLLALVIAFSGLIMAFDAIYYVTYKAWGGDKELGFIIPDNESDIVMSGSNVMPIDTLVPYLMKTEPDYKGIELHYPHSDSSSIYIEVSTSQGIYYNADYRFYDQYTGEELFPNSVYGRYATASMADKVMRMNYDIHVGAIGGLFGKVIAFIISFTMATLPISGFLIWYGRTFKKKLKKRKAFSQMQYA